MEAKQGGRDAVAGQLSADLIKELTGEDDLELIEDIEVIFNEVQYIGGLERCANLRSLTLIDTRLQCIDNLASVSMSLEKLMLTEQNIQRIEGLVLPNLRELYLQNNEISVLEGFENCPKLQRLWVFSNNIAKVRSRSATAWEAVFPTRASADRVRQCVDRISQPGRPIG